MDLEVVLEPVKGSSDLSAGVLNLLKLVNLEVEVIAVLEFAF